MSCCRQALRALRALRALQAFELARAGAFQKKVRRGWRVVTEAACPGRLVVCSRCFCTFIFALSAHIMVLRLFEIFFEEVVGQKEQVKCSYACFRANFDELTLNQAGSPMLKVRYLGIWAALRMFGRPQLPGQVHKKTCKTQGRAEEPGDGCERKGQT